MPTIGSSLRLSYKGTWSSGTAYAVNDVVFYNNGSYAALTSSTNQVPGVGTTYWGVLASATTPYPYQPWVSGGFYSAPVSGVAGVSAAQSNSFYGFTLRVPNSCSISALSVNVQTAVAGSSMDLWVYSDTGLNKPSARLGTVTVSTAATSTVTGTFGSPIAIASPQQLWCFYRMTSASTPSLTTLPQVVNWNGSAGASTANTLRNISAYNGSATVPADLSAATVGSVSGLNPVYVTFSVA